LNRKLADSSSKYLFRILHRHGAFRKTSPARGLSFRFDFLASGLGRTVLLPPVCEAMAANKVKPHRLFVRAKVFCISFSTFWARRAVFSSGKTRVQRQVLVNDCFNVTAKKKQKWLGRWRRARKRTLPPSLGRQLVDVYFGTLRRLSGTHAFLALQQQSLFLSRSRRMQHIVAADQETKVRKRIPLYGSISTGPIKRLTIRGKTASAFTEPRTAALESDAEVDRDREKIENPGEFWNFQSNSGPAKPS
jgi:hypothetical protein